MKILIIKEVSSQLLALQNINEPYSKWKLITLKGSEIECAKKNLLNHLNLTQSFFF